MQISRLLLEENLHLNLIAYPFRLFTFSQWAGSSMFTFSFIFLFRIFLWFPKVLVEKLNSRMFNNNISLLQALLLSIFVFPPLYMFFNTLDEKNSIWSFANLFAYSSGGVLNFLSGLLFHMIYQILKLLGGWLRNDFNFKGLAHLFYLIILIPIMCILEVWIEKSALDFKSLSITFLSILSYLVAYIIENKKEFEQSWNVFGNSKFIGG